MDEGISWLLLGLLAALLVAAAVSDLKKREIPHAVVIATAVLAVPFWWATGLPFWPGVALQVGIAFVVLAVFAGMFCMGWMGGGDVKLLTALALWWPWNAVIWLLVIMSLAGAVVTVATVIWSRVRSPSETLEVPYGVAIAFAGIWLITNASLTNLADL